MIWKILIGITVIAIVAGIIAYSLTSKYARIGTLHFTYLKEGKTQEAYDMFAQILKNEFAYDKFVEMNAFAPQIKDIKWQSRIYENGIARIEGFLILEDSTRVNTSMKLIKENDVWKIGSINVKPVETAAGTPELKPTDDSKPYQVLAQQLADELAKGNTAFLKDHLSPNMIAANDKEAIDDFIQKSKEKFANLDPDAGPLSAKPSEDKEFGGVDFFGNMGYLFSVHIVYADKTESDIEIYTVKEDGKIQIANIMTAY